MAVLGLSRLSSDVFETKSTARAKPKVIPISNGYPHSRQQQSEFEWGAGAQLEAQIPIEDLYPAPEVGTPELTRALSLLSESACRIGEALQLLREGDRIGSDVATQRTYALLPELFNCRRLGEGFAAVVNALMAAIENMNGTPLELRQLQAVNRVVLSLRSEPFPSFESACEHGLSLEEAGLTVEPGGYTPLIDWLDGKSVC